MGIETEYRFLLSALPALSYFKSSPIRQGYLSTDPQRTVRVRLSGEDSFLTVKGPKTGANAAEFDYPIPQDDAHKLLALCDPAHTIEKTRHYWKAGDGHVWEIDEFQERHKGLVIAEIELPAADTTFLRPEWLAAARDITTDRRYANAQLSRLDAAEIASLLP